MRMCVQHRHTDPHLCHIWVCSLATHVIFITEGNRIWGKTPELKSSKNNMYTLETFYVPFCKFSLIVTTTVCGRYYFHLNEDRVY